MISYEESGPGSLASTLEVPGHILKKTINGLSKGKTYSIRVSAATVIGSGQQSRPVTGTVLLQSTDGNDKMLLRSCVLEASHIKESLGSWQISASANLELYMACVAHEAPGADGRM